MAARLQAEENERIQRSKEESVAMARLDEADWVVHTKKVDRRVKTFKELLEERIAKEAALAEANKNTATLKAVAGSNELPNDKPDSCLVKAVVKVTATATVTLTLMLMLTMPGEIKRVVRIATATTRISINKRRAK